MDVVVTAWCGRFATRVVWAFWSLLGSVLFSPLLQPFAEVLQRVSQLHRQLPSVRFAADICFFGAR